MASLVIPTLNAGNQIKSLLEAIKEQTTKVDEIIVIDSSSSDNTIELAKKYGAQTSIIAGKTFDHGGTRALAGKNANADIIIFMTQDALPANECAIENLIRPMIEDGKIAAVYGRQLPAPEASPFASHLRAFNYPDTSYTRNLEDRKKYGLKTAFLSNSFAAYRKQTLEEIGWFKKGLIFGEDACAGAKLILAGYKIAYEADAKVFHSHNYSTVQEFKRYFDIGVFHKRESWLLNEFGKAEGEGMKYIKSELCYIMNRHRYDLIPEFIIRNFLKLAGYKLGQNYTHIPPCLIEKLSMHEGWWSK